VFEKIQNNIENFGKCENINKKGEKIK